MKKISWVNSLKELPEKHHFILMDILKFLCAFLVFYIHINLSQVCHNEFFAHVHHFFRNGICRIAVPFYFACSGFLLFRKINTDKESNNKVQLFIARILKLYGIWMILSLFNTARSHLWFLLSLPFAVGLVYLCLKIKIKPIYILLIGFVLYLFGLLGDSWYGLILKINNRYLTAFFDNYFFYFINTRNGLFMGFIFVAIGMFIAKTDFKINKILCFVSMVFFAVLFMLECYCLTRYGNCKEYNMFLFLVPFTFFFLYCVVHININDDKTDKYLRLRDMGMLIFYSHLVIYYLLDFVITKFNLPSNMFVIVHFVASLVCTILFAILVTAIAKKDKTKWIKWLYT